MDTNKKHRGPPRGNQNARKFGFYSHTYTSSEYRESKSASGGRLNPEIKLFKVLIARAASLLKPLSENSSLVSFQDSLSMLATVTVAVARLNSFYRTNEKLDPAGDLGMLGFLLNRGFTREEIVEETLGAGKRARGAQVGNANALKHGFYASIFKPEEILKLDAKHE